MIRVENVPAFEDNYIWLAHGADSHHVAIVDPGDAEPVLEALPRLGLEPAAILITHHHRDHTGGIADLLARYPGLPVYGPAGEPIPGVDHPLREGDSVNLPEAKLQLQVLETPGHTRGHICYVGQDLLFCGDTLFAAGCGRLFEGSAEQMYHSLEKIRALPDETRVYCAHEYTLANLWFARVVEPHSEALQRREAEAKARRAEGKPTVPSLLGEEKATNPFLRSQEANVAEAAEAFAGHPLAGPAEIFGTVRHWKDTLD